MQTNSSTKKKIKNQEVVFNLNTHKTWSSINIQQVTGKKVLHSSLRSNGKTNEGKFQQPCELDSDGNRENHTRKEGGVAR